MSRLETIHIELIDRMRDSRKVDPAWVATIAETIRSGAEVAPIDLIDDGERYRQITGQHRLQATVDAGEATIEARVFAADHFADEDEIKLHTLQENLVRRNLSVLDRACDIERMRDIYERQHPNAVRHGGRRAKTTDEEQAAKLATCFSDVAQETLAMGARSVRRALLIASAFDTADREQLALRPISNVQSDLETLATQKPKDRKALIAILCDHENDVTRLGEAMDRHFKRAKPRQLAKVEVASIVFQKLETKDRHAFFDSHAEEIDEWLATR